MTLTVEQARKMVGKVGAVVVGPNGIWGKPEYVTPDGWVGVRGPDRRLDECRADWLSVDPT